MRFAGFHATAVGKVDLVQVRLVHLAHLRLGHVGRHAAGIRLKKLQQERALLRGHLGRGQPLGRSQLGIRGVTFDF